ncbi:hypothetical protein B0H63DRAFT_474536 [Podospora didyma]|uniref:Uncharacterized protein n=1 Tax=Podospora didyma TaxID=330526 RepID=A0AAE0TVD3_9PEZI|nr:hypothetical protein B0H63DRAFT_474536 [Podospora didyma]
MSSAGRSKVGFPALYEDDDQRSIRKSEVEELSKHSGKNVKGYMAKSQLDAVNRLHEEETHKKQAEAIKHDPTLAATLHGNKPHKGAIIDKQLMEEEADMLMKKKGNKRSGSMPGGNY